MKSINKIMMKYRDLQASFIYEQNTKMKVIEKITEENSFMNEEISNYQFLL